MYHPIERTKGIERFAFQGCRRKYYRFRPAKWYGGIVTADVTACNLLCKFCWAGDEIRMRPENIGEFFSPEEAFKKLNAIGRRFGYRQVRLSGQEPTIGKEHLLKLLELIDGTAYNFVLETNGILIGYEEEFSRLTGTEAFQFQIEALKNLRDADVSCHASVVVSFSLRKRTFWDLDRLENIDPYFKEEIEKGKPVKQGTLSKQSA